MLAFCPQPTSSLRSSSITTACTLLPATGEVALCFSKGSTHTWWVGDAQARSGPCTCVSILFRPRVQRPVGMDARGPPALSRGASFEYRYMTEFQSHEPEFDYLKSLEIEEKINKVRWCRSSNNTRMLLSTNDKTVKLWKVGPICMAEAETCQLRACASRFPWSLQVYEKKVSCLSNFNLEGRSNAPTGSPRPNALANSPVSLRLSQPLRLPRVRPLGAGLGRCALY